jgi:voltage-gated potassium channel
MNPSILLILRRMRVPLIVLSTVYMVAVFGMTLIPGQDDQGNVWYMDFFHAFYFVSFMGTTIGFGEIPYPFTEEQRLWATVCVYLTVTAWFYTIGTILSLLQQEALKRALTEGRFIRAVKNIREPFFIICGYGDAGIALVRGLVQYNIRSVILDNNQLAIDHLTMENHPISNPGLCGDAGNPSTLLHAGLQHPHCAGIVAITNENHVNLKIALTSKLLNPQLPATCRADFYSIEANMKSFGTKHIVDPFDIFATRFLTTLNSPNIQFLHDWLSAKRGDPIPELIEPPRGLWILCGYGRFGRAMYKRMRSERLDIIVIEASPNVNGLPKDTILGTGTEAHTLRNANIENAVGIIAGTDDDVNNLSIIMTAKAINRGLFVIARQNVHDNQALFDEIAANLTMKSSEIIANHIRILLTTPLMTQFKDQSRFKPNQWACVIISRLVGMVTEEAPSVWAVTIDKESACALISVMEDNNEVKLSHLTHDPRQHSELLHCIPLLLERSGSSTTSFDYNQAGRLLPSEDTVLKPGDQLLFCGRDQDRQLMEWNLKHRPTIDYLMTGKDCTQSRVLHWLEKKLSHTVNEASTQPPTDSDNDRQPQ